MLSKADDYPIHQSPEPIAYAGQNATFTIATFLMAMTLKVTSSSPWAWVFIPIWTLSTRASH